MSRIALTLLACILCGCSSLRDNTKAYLDRVDRTYNCVGVELGNEAAICIDDVALTVTVTF